MEIISAASSLRQQLVALHNSDRTVRQLDHELDRLGQGLMMSTLAENQSHYLRLLSRVSVAEGVCHMYKQYSTSKWSQIQNTARCIKSSIEDGAQLSTPEFTVTPANGGTSSDKAITEWTSVMCELSRDE